MRVPFNRPFGVKLTATGGAPVPVAFSASDAASKIATGLANNGYSHLMVKNGFAEAICLCFQPADSAAPSATSNQRIFVDGGETLFFDDISILDWLFLESDSGGTITSGVLKINIW